ncbi:MAG: MerR family transcriptional regulator [Gammaproteobacteria bacterium]|nr:MerR family transcriptional regulator [Gammaproteobacteria bacterium]
MAEWRIKEVSDLTKISIRMLRHYDKIDLLKPSYRSSNGYRCYTAVDLAVLQQIVSLKYFGFSLKAIKDLLHKHQNVYAHLQAQQQVLKEKSAQLQEVTAVLGDILKRLNPSETPDYNDSLLLISRYHMSNKLRSKLKVSWAGKTLNESQFEELLTIYEQCPEELDAREKIIEQINNEELGDPTGPEGKRVVLFFRNLQLKMKSVFSKQAHLGSSLLKDMQAGKLTQLELTPEGCLWLSQAMLSYWLSRWDLVYDKIINHLSSDPIGKVGQEIATEWEELVEEYLSVGPRTFLTGMLLWEDVARQTDDLKGLKQMPSPQEMSEKVRAKLWFNPEATAWISKALEVHTS